MNPMAITARCDLFVMSSFYEGLPVVLFEADIVGLPVFSTRVKGAEGFLEEYKGHLVEDSEEGILSGMLDFINGKIKPLNVDMKEYNRRALAAFEGLLK